MPTGALVFVAVLTVAGPAPAAQGQAPAPAGPAAQSPAPIPTRDLAEIYVLYLQGLELSERTGGVDAAIASYRKALEIAPAAADIRAALASLYVRNNQILEARVEARRAIEHDSDNRDAHRVLGLIESAMIQQSPTSTPEMLQEAIGHLEYALAGGVVDLAAQLTIAELYLQHGNTTRAAEAARRFLDQRPGFPRAVAVLVAALEASGRSSEVGAVLAEMRAEPAGDLLALAESLLDGGSPRHAVTLLEPRVTSPVDEDLDTGAFGRMAELVGIALTQLNENKRAIAVMEGARARKASGRGLLFSLGAAYERDGQHDAAERTFRTLISDDPGHHQALNYLGYMLADRGQKLDEAVGFISRALAIAGDNPSYLDSLGWAFFRQRKFEEARPPLERAAAGAPKVSVIQDHLGDVYFELKRYPEAVTAFDRALGGDRDDVDVAAITKKRDRARDLSTQK